MDNGKICRRARLRAIGDIKREGTSDNSAGAKYDCPPTVVFVFLLGLDRQLISLVIALSDCTDRSAIEHVFKRRRLGWNDLTRDRLEHVDRVGTDEDHRAHSEPRLELTNGSDAALDGLMNRGEARNAVEAGGRDPADVLADLLDSEGDPDADAFWKQVATNLAAKRLRLLFVADEIPDSLVHIVEFLNQQMRDVEVLAVEVKQYRGGGTQTLVPRVIGRDTTGSDLLAIERLALSMPRSPALAAMIDGIVRLDAFRKARTGQ